MSLHMWSTGVELQYCLHKGLDSSTQNLNRLVPTVGAGTLLIKGSYQHLLWEHIRFRNQLAHIVGIWNMITFHASINPPASLALPDILFLYVKPRQICRQAC